jgi:hypothetical protein
VTRRALPLVLATVGLTVALSGCATFTEADTVVTVGAIRIDQSRLDAMLTEYSTRGDLFGTTPLADDTTAPADQARTLLGAMVVSAAVQDVLAAAGDAITSGDRALFLDTLAADSPVLSLESGLADLIADTQTAVIESTMSRAEPIPAAELERRYAIDPGSTGFLCVRHILLASEADALDVLTELGAGTDFAELAGERSIEEIASLTGGAIDDGDSACVPTSQYAQAFDPVFTAAAHATPGTEVSEPVETTFGWHVIMHRPWAEVGSEIVTAHATDTTGRHVLDARLAGDDIRIDPRYGRWNPATNRVEPIG